MEAQGPGLELASQYQTPVPSLTHSASGQAPWASTPHQSLRQLQLKIPVNANGSNYAWY